MGMDYYIYSDLESDSPADDKLMELGTFPSGLSFFFEQIGGYREKSEVSQVSKILNIDLELFQNLDFPDNDDIEKTWQPIQTVIDKVVEFRTAIKNRPDYYKQVKHDGTGYPRDFGYLSKNEITADLDSLLANLEELKKMGSKKIRFYYS